MLAGSFLSFGGGAKSRARPYAGSKGSKRRQKSAKVQGFLGGRFYFLTIFYGFWFFCGGLIGFARKGSYVCLGVSVSLGVVLMLLGFAHLIEYNRGVKIELYLVLLPFSISSSTGIITFAIYGVQGGEPSKFVPLGMVGLVSSIAAALYALLLWRDFFSKKSSVSYNTYSYESLENSEQEVPRAGSSYDPWLPGSRDPLFER
jgi:uncharacterized membrane protein (UPF0136 family)